ncbi:MAG: hypothetical protein JXA21_23970 [Anaerolineae bacterium]|nr:hypothetical protein [Anaerolineae bacterium]
MINKHFLKCLFVCMALIALTLTAPQIVLACGGGIICVNADASGPIHDGLSWTTAYTNVQDALAATTAIAHEIWIAEGIYYPDLGAGQINDAVTATFAIQPGMTLYGGFAGTESTLDLRDPATYITVLSGDIDGNDLINAHGVVSTTDHIIGNNAYHVVTNKSVTETAQVETARLDGFTITAGDARTYGYEKGGGMENDGNISLSNVIFEGNRAFSGGGMYNHSSKAVLMAVIFRHNRGIPDGGGMYNAQDGNAILTDVTFSHNGAVTGGGMYNTGHVTMTNGAFSGNAIGRGSGAGISNAYSGTLMLNDVTFKENSTAMSGGGIANSGEATLVNITFSGNFAGVSGGGMANSGSGAVNLINVAFYGNQGYVGGGMSTNGTHPTLTNATFGGNFAHMNCGGLSGPVTLVNSIVWGNESASADPQYKQICDMETSAIIFSDIQWPGGVYTGTGNINVDPQFVAPITATAAPTTTGDYHLRVTSPAINAGNSLSVTVTTDLDGNPRIASKAVDMGPYEIAIKQIFLPLVLKTE